MSTNEIQQIIDVVAKNSLGFFALYIIYHYLGQILGVFLLLKVVKFIVQVADGWIMSWLWKNTPMNNKFVHGDIVKVAESYQDKAISGKLVRITNFFDIKHYLQRGYLPVKLVEDKDSIEYEVPIMFLEKIMANSHSATE